MNQEVVKIKRLDNCINPSDNYNKRMAVLDYLDKFDGTVFSLSSSRLRQFDETPGCTFREIYQRILENDITEVDLDNFITNIGLTDIPIAIVENFKEIPVPTRATTGAAGFDLQAAIDDSVTIMPGSTIMVPTGLSISMPNNMELQVRPRSGLAAKNGITVLNSPGTVDSDYGGQICVILINHSKRPFRINRGDRIAQGVFNQVVVPILEEVDSLEKTERGAKGFGSTGV